MCKWVLFGIEPLLPEVVQPQSDGVSVPLFWRIPSLLTRVLSWAAYCWRWPAFLWASNTAVATAGDISDSTDVTQAGSAEDEASSHALIRSSSHGTPPSHAIASDLQQQSISSSSVSRAIPYDINCDLAEIQAEHAEASVPPRTPRTPQRRFTWSGRSSEAFSPTTDTDESGAAVTISRSGEILINAQQHLHRASSWPRASSTCPDFPQPLTASAPSRSQPDLAISDNNDIILATSMPQDCLNLSPALSQAAGSVADTNQTASNQHFHKTYIVKAAHVGSGGIEEVKGPAPLEAAGSGSPRIAANHSTNKETEEGKPQWKDKADAKGGRALQQNDKSGKRLPL